MLKKDWIFFGEVISSEKQANEHKFIFRKTLKYNTDVSYEIIGHPSELEYQDLEEYVKSNNDKVLISVLRTYVNPKEKHKKIKENFLIFKKTGEKAIYDYLITESVSDKSTDFSVYLNDISKKMVLWQNEDSIKFNLTCCFNTDTSLLLVFYEKMDEDGNADNYQHDS